MLWKNPNELFGQPNTYGKSYFKSIGLHAGTYQLFKIKKLIKHL